ncbi:TPA_asm: hypothetical protein HUJ06_000134 [Nelumbo nucifera]|uniref:Uncharacterized protein n=1 Tax=Nelumbo nucifera TaxID=4432 RepID=A0A822Z304_NELNU|nr:TPA_asm: hypothetical protein HUJ06_008466 [Nelumbo nucifera]DAD49758.1 TPA_asm: hypothetical protein HUJ06_000134 [Nelumbo nucifera]
MFMLHSSDLKVGEKIKRIINQLIINQKFETHVINLFWLTREKME